MTDNNEYEPPQKGDVYIMHNAYPDIVDLILDVRENYVRILTMTSGNISILHRSMNNVPYSNTRWIRI